ncbi:hypothetical protein [Pseudomonas sp.]|uniref:hypothetical protein n=1 Tax=Pseudomonas sp. TaxID=306 RepID=UPI00272CA361|nr:hypothetical protein [Pseudomonas sp.]
MKHLGFGLLGKGLFACAAIALMLGGEQDASAKQVPQPVASLQERLGDARPAPLPSVRANVDLGQNGEVATPSWVF